MIPSFTWFQVNVSEARERPVVIRAVVIFSSALYSLVPRLSSTALWEKSTPCPTPPHRQDIKSHGRTLQVIKKKAKDSLDDKKKPCTPTHLWRMTPKAVFTLRIYFYGGLREQSISRNNAALLRCVEHTGAPLA